MQFDKIMGYIQAGKDEGATLYMGGNIDTTAQKGGKGYYIEPTIFTDVKPNMKIVREEIFGPVVAIAKFKTEEEVIELANDTSYGLAAGLHTKDYETAIRVTGELEAGTVWVNMYNFVHWSMPFGYVTLVLPFLAGMLTCFPVVTRSLVLVANVVSTLLRTTPRSRQYTSTWACALQMPWIRFIQKHDFLARVCTYYVKITNVTRILQLLLLSILRR